MDVLGASMLAARIRAGVRIGQMVELLGDSDSDGHRERGDLGLVTGFTVDGKIVVKWGGGAISSLNPAVDSYEAILPRLADSA